MTHMSEGESSIDKIQLIKYMRFINKKYAIMSKLLHIY